MDAADGHLGGASSSSGDDGVEINVLCYDLFFGRIFHWLYGLFFLKIRLDSTVGQFKTFLDQGFNFPIGEIRMIIYNNRILGDHKTLDSCGVEAGHTVHVVRAPFVPTAPTRTTNNVPNRLDTGPVTDEERFAICYLLGFALCESHVMSAPQLIRKILMRASILRKFLDRDPRFDSLVNNLITLRSLFDESEGSTARGSGNGNDQRSSQNAPNIASGSSNVSGSNSGAAPPPRSQASSAELEILQDQTQNLQLREEEKSGHSG